jgi:hypothetical protein
MFTLFQVFDAGNQQFSGKKTTDNTDKYGQKSDILNKKSMFIHVVNGKILEFM